MVESTTLNYHWTKPELTKSPTTWGKYLNDDLDAIDGLVFANQQAIVPIGAMTMFAGPTAPTNWLICDGRLLSTAAPYDKLFAVLQYAFGGSGAQFALPNLATHFPFGANATNALGATGGAATITLDATMIPAHTHTASQPAHGHAATQTAHAHVIATGSHSHGVLAHAHGSSLVKQGPGTAALVSSSVGFTIAGSGNTDNATSSTDTAGNLGGNTDAQAPAIAVPTAQPAITVAAAGGGLAHNNMPPWVAINFIIRYL